MATEMFGGSPDELRQALLNQRAAQFAAQTPQQQLGALAYKGGAGLGQALGGLFGVDVTPPEVRMAQQRQEILKGVNLEDPDAMLQAAMKASQMGDYAAAQELSTKARAIQLQKAQLGKAVAETSKLERAAQQDVALRDALAGLPANPSQEDILKVVTQFGSPDKVLAVVQGASDKAAARQQALDAAKLAADAKVEAAKEAGASRLEIAKIQADSRVQLAQLTAALKQGLQGNKPLPASLQKEEGADLTAIDTYEAQQRALAPAIASLTPNAQGVRKLELGPVKNAFYAAQNAAGNSTPESRAYEGLKSAVDTAVNLQVSAEKGVQTDKDVLRFAQALIGAYGRNDTKATLEALTRYEQSLAKAAEKTQNRLESRRKAQNVEPYGFKPSVALGTPGNPIKLD